MSLRDRAVRLAIPARQETFQAAGDEMSAVGRGGAGRDRLVTGAKGGRLDGGRTVRETQESIPTAGQHMAVIVSERAAEHLATVGRRFRTSR